MRLTHTNQSFIKDLKYFTPYNFFVCTYFCKISTWFCFDKVIFLEPPLALNRCNSIPRIIGAYQNMTIIKNKRKKNSVTYSNGGKLKFLCCCSNFSISSFRLFFYSGTDTNTFSRYRYQKFTSCRYRYFRYRYFYYYLNLFYKNLNEQIKPRSTY